LTDFFTTVAGLAVGTCTCGATDVAGILTAGCAARNLVVVVVAAAAVVVVVVDVVVVAVMVVDVAYRCVGDWVAGVFDVAVRVKTSTSSRSGLDHITRCAPLSDESRRTMVNKSYRGCGRIAVHDGEFPSRD
jgi:hypothetical protein